MKLEMTTAKNSFKYGWLLSRIMPYITPYWFRITLGFLVAIPLGLLDGVTAFALKPYMDYVVGGKALEFTFLNNDVVITSRNICIDNKTERSEHILDKLAPKQIIILDSCSGEREDEHTANESRAQILLENKHVNKRFMARKKYEEKCNNCVSQTLKFYAAERGTYANDTSEGGIYSTELLRVLNHTQDDISIFSAHKKADKLIRTLTDQKPDYDVPRLLNYLPGVIHV